MAEIGKVTDIPCGGFEWRMEDFSTLFTPSAKKDKWYTSPLFYIGRESWYLKIVQKGRKENESIGYIGVYLARKSSGPPINVDYSVIPKTMNEEIDQERHTSHVFKKRHDDWGWSQFLKRSEYLESRSELGLPDVLTVICTMKYLDPVDDASEKVTAQCSYCKKPFEAKTISFHEGKCLDKPIKCPHSCDVIPLRDWYERQYQKSRSEACEKVLQDWKAIMLDGDLSDILIKVKGEEFRLHRTVLAARNSYFHSMFTSDMKEKNTGIVSIEDCEPDIFRTFIHFVYTGKVDKLSPENVCELYEVADKYQEDQLKKQCFELMKKTLSEDTFCDFIVLALKYDERELFEKAVKYFTSKPNKIVHSAKWQNYLEKYPTQANELLIKLVDRHFK